MSLSSVFFEIDNNELKLVLEESFDSNINTICQNITRSFVPFSFETSFLETLSNMPELHKSINSYIAKLTKELMYLLFNGFKEDSEKYILKISDLKHEFYLYEKVDITLVQQTINKFFSFSLKTNEIFIDSFGIASFYNTNTISINLLTELMNEKKYEEIKERINDNYRRKISFLSEYDSRKNFTEKEKLYKIIFDHFTPYEITMIIQDSIRLGRSKTNAGVKNLSDEDVISFLEDFYYLKVSRLTLRRYCEAHKIDLENMKNANY